MKSLLLSFFFLNFSFSLFSQSVSLGEALNQKIIIEESFQENILPFLDLKTTQQAKMNPTSHILKKQMTFEELIEVYGLRALNVEDMAGLLTNNLVDGNLKNIKLLKNSSNFFVVTVAPQKVYFVDMTWLPKNNCWIVGAFHVLDVYLNAGSQIFTKY